MAGDACLRADLADRGSPAMDGYAFFEVRAEAFLVAVGPVCVCDVEWEGLELCVRGEQILCCGLDVEERPAQQGIDDI